MAKRKNWEIKGLKKKTYVCDAAKLVMSQRISLLADKMNEYFTAESDESLHQVRIAIRRIRYNLELFTDCFDKKLFKNFYNDINALQDITGQLRDLDVLKLNLNSLFKEKGTHLPDTVFLKVEKKKEALRSKVNLELMKFKHSKVLKEFCAQLK